MEFPKTEPSASNKGTPKDDQSLMAADVEAALTQIFKPNKRNICLATMLGTVLILIQCVRAGYLPEFDWSSGAGAIVLVAVLALSLVGMLFLTLCVALPGLPLANERKAILMQYIGSIALSSLWMAILFGVFTLAESSKWLGWFCHGPWGFVRVLVTLWGPIMLAAWYMAYDSSSKSTVNDSSQGPFKKWWEHAKKCGPYIRGLGMVPFAYGSLFWVLFQGAEHDWGSWEYCTITPAIVVILVNAVVLLRPRQPLVYVSVAAFIFALLCVPASSGSFSILGLGGRTVEFYLEKSEYAADLARGNMIPASADAQGKLYQVYLRLRLGSEVAISADGKGWGREANVVAIPRNAIRGLRFVPPTTKNDKRPSAVEAKNPYHLIAASKQWALQQAAERYIDIREEKWKADQKSGLSVAQADWLKWARETTTQLAPFAYGYPILPDAKQPVLDSGATDQSEKTRRDPAAASPQP
ncbi:MAG: hypothetical protein BWX86_01715 [Verrucomicrobia bacterium ADurb.Bin122]|nr:MAG: hypothetical protein BWX86_01715 [Verrucomicrobia bacterium ADurb.Bin122]